MANSKKASQLQRGRDSRRRKRERRAARHSREQQQVVRARVSGIVAMGRAIKHKTVSGGLTFPLDAEQREAFDRAFIDPERTADHA